MSNSKMSLSTFGFIKSPKLIMDYFSTINPCHVDSSIYASMEPQKYNKFCYDAVLTLVMNHSEIEALKQRIERYRKVDVSSIVIVPEVYYENIEHIKIYCNFHDRAESEEFYEFDF